METHERLVRSSRYTCTNLVSSTEQELSPREGTCWLTLRDTCRTETRRQETTQINKFKHFRHPEIMSSEHHILINVSFQIPNRICEANILLLTATSANAILSGQLTQSRGGLV